jgi:hypothetical protein
MNAFVAHMAREQSIFFLGFALGAIYVYLINIK